MGPSCTEVKQKETKTKKQRQNKNKKRNLFTHRAPKSSLGNSFKGVRAFQVEFELEMLVFVEGGKSENPEKNPRSKNENQQQTQPIYDAESGNRIREYSHHCVIPVPLRFASFFANGPAPFEISFTDKSRVEDDTFIGLRKVIHIDPKFLENIFSSLNIKTLRRSKPSRQY